MTEEVGLRPGLARLESPCLTPRLTKRRRAKRGKISEAVPQISRAPAIKAPTKPPPLKKLLASQAPTITKRAEPPAARPQKLQSKPALAASSLKSSAGLALRSSATGRRLKSAEVKSP